MIGHMVINSWLIVDFSIFLIDTIISVCLLVIEQSWIKEIMKLNYYPLTSRYMWQVEFLRLPTFETATHSVKQLKKLGAGLNILRYKRQANKQQLHSASPV